MSSSGAAPSSSASDLPLDTASDTHYFQQLRWVHRVMTSLQGPVHPYSSARTSATTGRRSIPHDLPTCLWTALTSVRRTAVVNVIWRPPWARGNSDGHIGAVMVHHSCAVLDGTPTCFVLGVGRGLVRNLD